MPAPVELPSRLHVRAATSKSGESRDVTLHLEAAKELDTYINDIRTGDTEPDASLFTDRSGQTLTGNGVRKLFDRLKVSTGIDDLCAHMLRHTWATNYHRSASGSRFDLQSEGGWRVLQHIRAPRIKDEPRRALTDDELLRLLSHAGQGETELPEIGHGAAQLGRATRVEDVEPGTVNASGQLPPAVPSVGNGTSVANMLNGLNNYVGIPIAGWAYYNFIWVPLAVTQAGLKSADTEAPAPRSTDSATVPSS